MSLSLKKNRPRATLVRHRAVDLKALSPAALIRALGLPSGSPIVLLDSAGGRPDLCRYTFLAWDPRLEASVRSGKATVTAEGGRYSRLVSSPFPFFRELLEELKPEASPSADEIGLPLTGGAFGLVSYDAGRYIEKLPELAANDLAIPEFHFIFPRRLICYDHHNSRAHILIEDPDPGDLAEVEKALLSQSGAPVAALPDAFERHAFSSSAATRSNMTGESFRHMVRRAKEYIAAGDIFQSNLSQRLELDFAGDSLGLYEALRAVNPSPFAGYLDFGDYQIISSSPERLVQLSGRRAQTRPIAGTRRRGIDIDEDEGLKAELNLDPKERAEHIMLVDLERNDLGRVCDYGSVEVNELMVNETYSHVIHIVSNVRGTLHKAKDALDLLKAMFPGGTITGCPKVRCLEIIDELEPVRRGPYTGSFGYIGFNGNMDLNIIIRTLVRQGDKAYAQAGAGIVADSDPEREYRETLRKAEAMVQAVELAGQAAPGSSPLTAAGSDHGIRTLLKEED